MNTTGKANEDLRFHVAVLPAVENLPISHGFKKKKEKPRRSPRGDVNLVTKRSELRSAARPQAHVYLAHK